MSARLRSSSTAVTFIELVIASAIFTVIIIIIYSSFYSGITGYKNISGVIDLHQSSGFFISRINSELRNSFAYALGDSRFRGDGNQISFFTLSDVYAQGRIDKQYSRIFYLQEANKVKRLCRRGKNSLMDNAEVESEEFFSDIESMNFSYGVYDMDSVNLSWKDSWQDNTRLPDAVKVALILKDKVSYNFERTIFLRNVEK